MLQEPARLERIWILLHAGDPIDGEDVDDELCVHWEPHILRACTAHNTHASRTEPQLRSRNVSLMTARRSGRLAISDS
jgi:hypothetical protein